MASAASLALLFFTRCVFAVRDGLPQNKTPDCDSVPVDKRWNLTNFVVSGLGSHFASLAQQTQVSEETGPAKYSEIKQFYQDLFSLAQARAANAAGRKEPTPKERIPQAVFEDLWVDLMKELLPKYLTGNEWTLTQQEEFRLFLAKVFEASVAMMPPVEAGPPRVYKDTLGGHCFKYASILAHEYYFLRVPTDHLDLVKPVGDRDFHASPLKLLQFEMDSEWSDAEPDKIPSGELKGRITRDNFIHFYGQFYSNRVQGPEGGGTTAAGEELPEQAPTSEVFEEFLGRTWDAAHEMMNPWGAMMRKESLGAHCFKYAGVLVGEYYFTGNPGTGGFPQNRLDL